ncbi:hypothetical protein IKB17_03775 [bacterium]|nr:hypothetical protein [bacterium]
MSGEIRGDGKFTIKQGQGLSQAICEELNLNNNEIKLLNSVWTQIFEQVDLQQEENLNAGKAGIYTGGNDLNGPSSKNYVVMLNQAIEFSQNIWSEIVNLVNGVLNPSPQLVDSNIEENDFNIDVNAEEGLNEFYETQEEEGKALAADLKKIFDADFTNMKELKKLLGKITKDNVAYVLENYPDLPDKIDDVFRFGFGFDKDDVYDYLLKPLLECAKEFGKNYSFEGVSITLDNAKNYSLDDMKKVLSYVSNDVIEMIKTPNNDKYNQVQQLFDGANSFLEEVANMDPKPQVEIDSGKMTKTVKLKDDRKIEVKYNQDGEIEEIKVMDGHWENQFAIRYTKDKAYYNMDSKKAGYEGFISSGYDFEALKALVEEIFGKSTSGK